MACCSLQERHLSHWHERPPPVHGTCTTAPHAVQVQSQCVYATETCPVAAADSRHTVLLTPASPTLVWPAQVHCVLLQHLTRHHEGATAQLAQQVQQAQQALQEAAALHGAEVVEAELELQTVTEEFQDRLSQVLVQQRRLSHAAPSLWPGLAGQKGQGQAGLRCSTSERVWTVLSFTQVGCPAGLQHGQPATS